MKDQDDVAFLEVSDPSDGLAKTIAEFFNAAGIPCRLEGEQYHAGNETISFLGTGMLPVLETVKNALTLRPQDEQDRVTIYGLQKFDI